MGSPNVGGSEGNAFRKNLEYFSMPRSPGSKDSSLKKEVSLEKEGVFLKRHVSVVNPNAQGSIKINAASMSVINPIEVPSSSPPLSRPIQNATEELRNKKDENLKTFKERLNERELVRVRAEPSAKNVGQEIPTNTSQPTTTESPFTTPPPPLPPRPKSKTDNTSQPTTTESPPPLPPRPKLKPKTAPKGQLQQPRAAQPGTTPVEPPRLRSHKPLPKPPPLPPRL